MDDPEPISTPGPLEDVKLLFDKLIDKHTGPDGNMHLTPTAIRMLESYEESCNKTGKGVSVTDVLPIMALADIKDRADKKGPVPFGTPDDIAFQYAMNSNHAALKEMADTGHEFKIHCAYAACANGNLELLSWLSEQGCPIEFACYKFAIVCRTPEYNLDLITQRHSMLCLCSRFFLVSMSQDKMDSRNLRNNTHILDWLFKTGIPMASRATFLAACLCKDNCWGVDWLYSKFDVNTEEAEQALRTTGHRAKLQAKSCLVQHMQAQHSSTNL